MMTTLRTAGLAPPLERVTSPARTTHARPSLGRPGSEFPKARPGRAAVFARRRRRALAVVVVVVFAGALLLAGPRASAPASRPGAPRSTVMRSDQTLWDLAERYGPADIDPRAYVDAVLDLNGLREPPQRGQKIVLPR